MQRAIGGREVAREREHHRDDVLGCRNRVAGRRVEHEHAVPSGRVDVDVVDADTGTPDNAQRGAAAKISAVTFVSLRTTSAS